MSSLKALTKKKIDSPLAKYNNVGQLFCVLCNTPVKNEMFWTGHVNGRGHKESLLALKKGAGGGAVVAAGSSSSASGTPNQHPQKRPAPPQQQSKEMSSTTTSDSDDDDDDTAAVMMPPPAKRPNRMVAKPGHESGSQKREVQDAEDELKRMIMESSSGGRIGSAARDVQSVTESQDDEPSSSSSQQQPPSQQPLPEGFFDDPKADAKARGMKFKDPQDAEWDRFVKEIATEDVKSSELVGMDQEESAAERELDQIEEQMAQWQRVIDLEKRAEEWGKAKVQNRKGIGTRRNGSGMDSGAGTSMDIDDENGEDTTNGIVGMENKFTNRRGLGTSGNYDEDENGEEDEDEYNEELEWRNKKR